MKSKIVFKTKKEFDKWTKTSNLLAKSLCSFEEVLRQYNRLKASDRLDIKRSFLKCDEIRRTKMTNGESESDLEISIMVDAHILATEYNVDPLTVVLCINPICKSNEKIYIK